jgi:hypothetical protein
MEELFRSYWWLMFPVGWMVFGAFRGWLAYRARRDAMDLLKSYAEAGREPPAALVARLRTDSAF